MPNSDKITVLIADDILDTHENLKKLLYFERDLEVIGSAMDGQQAVDLVKQFHPDVVLMDINMPGLDGITATERIQTLGVPSQIIMMSVQGETDYLRRSMLAGAREFLIKPFSGEELADSVRRVNKLRGDRVARGADPHPGPPSFQPHGSGGRVITVFSPKGGVGRTTIICNLAVALREWTAKRVAVVDCNLQFGDVGILLNIQSSKTIADLLKHLDHMDSELLDTIMVSHSSGVRVLLAPPRPEMADLFTGEAIKTILGKLQENYDYVLVDTWPSFQDTMLAALDVSDHILVVLTLELPAIKNVKLFLEVADALGYPRDKTLLVLNRANSTGGISVSDVEASLKRSIAASIVSDGRLVTYALNQGIPFVLTSRNSPVSKCVVDLAKLLGSQTVQRSRPVSQPISQQAEADHKPQASGWTNRLPFGRAKHRLSASAANR
ncbi:MAG: response regulator [Chloroflexi bacterium]|nr:response regulator [Chloroflexota bacterium]